MRVSQKEKTKVSPLKKKEERTFYALISPFILSFVFLSVFPMGMGLFLSFTNYSGFNLDTAKWVGLSNYQKVFNDSEAMHSLLRTLELSLIIIPLTMILAFILAMMLIQNVKFQGGFRTIYYLPSVVPFVAAGLMWKILFSRDRGMLNAVLGMFGIEPVFWLGPEMCTASLIIMCLWGAGGGILINIAGLKNIPNELYESASIDGARFFTKLFRITIPLFTPILLFNLLLAIIGNLQMYAQPVMLATSGTGLLAVPFKDNYLYLVHIYQQVFGSQRFGYGLALSWVIVVIILVFTLLVLKSSKRWVNYDL